MKIALIVALLSSALATPAVAQTAIAENFDSEAGGGTALSYNSFSQFDVTNGSVDVLHQPNSFSLNCSGRGGSCVDLDGTTNSGGTLTTKNALLFNAGRLVTLLFDLSGNQRGAGSDNFFAGFDFGAGSGAVVNDFTFGGCFGNFNFGSFGRVNSATACCTTYDAAPFSRYSISFTSGSTGTVKGFVGTDSVDNQGPILDNFQPLGRGRSRAVDLGADVRWLRCGGKLDAAPYQVANRYRLRLIRRAGKFKGPLFSTEDGGSFADPVDPATREGGETRS